MSRAHGRSPLLLLTLVSLPTLACEGDFGAQPERTTAVVKFCNTRLGADSRPNMLTLEIGNPVVRISARSGTCAPLAGQGCLAVQTGTAVPIVMREDGRELTSQLLEMHSGEEWVLVAYPDAPILDGGALVPALPCSTFDWDRLD